MRLIDADALKGPLELQQAAYARIGATDRAKAYADCLWEIAQAPTVATDTNVLGKWFSVKDRLPENEQQVVVITVDGFCEVVNFEKTKGRWWGIEGWYPTDRITHWMPIPVPEQPKEVTGE